MPPAPLVFEMLIEALPALIGYDDDLELYCECKCEAEHHVTLHVDWSTGHLLLTETWHPCKGPCGGACEGFWSKVP